MSAAPIHLDCQAATPLLPHIREEMGRFFSAHHQSPWVPSVAANPAREALQFARGQIARLVGADDSYEVIFTASGSEANNLVVKGMAFAAPPGPKQIVHAGTDHPSILGAIDFLASKGWATPRKLRVDSLGHMDPAQWRENLTGETLLACAHLANHDLGAIQPVEQFVHAAHERGVPVLIDATYAGAWVDFSLANVPADFVTLSSHRFHGPKGVGVLIKKRDIKITPLIHGGLQENGLRAGHENVPAIYGAGLAAQFARENAGRFQSEPCRLQKLFLEGIAGLEGIHLLGPEPGPQRAPNSLCLGVEGVEAEELAIVCDRFGLGLTGGSACSSRREKIPHTLRELGTPGQIARGAVMLGFCVDHTPEQMAVAAERFIKSVRRVRSLSV